MPVEKQSEVTFPTPGSYLVFKTVNCSLWICFKSLILIASSLSIIINFFCGPCWDLLFFYSSCLLQASISIYKDSILLFIYSWLCSAASGTFTPRSWIEPRPPAVEVQSLKQRTTRKVPKDFKQEISEKGIWRRLVGKHE